MPSLPLPPPTVRRIVYLGAPAAAVPPLVALVRAGFDVPLVVTRPDRRRGRGSATSPSPVKAAALELGLEVTSDVAAVTTVDADLGVVVAYGALLRPPVLGHLPLVNLHFSLLPRWRGAAPVERALLEGDARTGVCVMAVEAGLDEGSVFRSVSVPIGPEESAEELRERLVAVGVDALLDCCTIGFGVPVPQVGTPTYATKLTAEDRHLHWDGSAEVAHRVVRIGRAWTTFRGARLLVHRARRCAAPDPVPGDPAPGAMSGTKVRAGDGWLELVEVQPEGRGRIDAAAWLHGVRPAPGDRLGT